MTARPRKGVRPLLKWAGGKRQLLPYIRRFYPASFNQYWEPFLGSGAVFFDLYGRGRLAGHVVELSRQQSRSHSVLRRRPKDAVEGDCGPYLNRTGFDGLFRLNAAGRFNVPAGRYRPKAVK
jgi:DNA adenine methylase